MRRRIAPLLAALAAACTSAVPTTSPPRTAQPAPTGPTPGAPAIQVRYRIAADVFEVLDNSSSWYRKKCDPEYRAAWESQLRLTPDDERWFERYAEVRKRHYPIPPDDDGPPSLFAPEKHDAIADAFYAADSVAAALASLRTRLPADDVATLEGFYAAMQPRAQRWFDESAAFIDAAKGMEARLSSADARAFSEKMTRFYGLPSPAPFTVLYVWWPPVDHVQASNRGPLLLMKYNPTRHREGAKRDVDIPIHEMAHFSSSRQSTTRKRALSAAFLSSCTSHPEISPALLEEPLAVAQQKVFLSIVDPGRLALDAPWYGGAPWISDFAKRIYPSVRARLESGEPMDEAFMRDLGAHCGDGP